MLWWGDRKQIGKICKMCSMSEGAVFQRKMKQGKAIETVAGCRFRSGVRGRLHREDDI